MREKLIIKSYEIDTKIKSITKGTTMENYYAFDYSNISHEIDEFIFISDKIIESLYFVDFLYEVPSLKKQLFKVSKSDLNEILNIRFKDIVKNPRSYLIKQLTEEVFEAILIENDHFTVNNKLEKLSISCPNILNQNDKDIITANVLIKLSTNRSTNNINKKEMISKAIQMMTANPENIRLEKTVKLLGELEEVGSIIQICIAKAIYLNNHIEPERQFLRMENMTVSDTTSYYTGNVSREKKLIYDEYNKCLYIIFKVLDAIYLTIQNHGKEYHSDDPEYINSIVYAKRNKWSLETKQQLQNDVIEEILKHDISFLHNLLFYHLESKGMVENIKKIKSPYIENYLQSQITQDQYNPKRLEELYRFYMTAGNYSSAIEVLVRLVAFDNSQLENDSGLARQFIRLRDRINYVNDMILCLNKQMEVENKTEEIQKYQQFMDIALTNKCKFDVQSNALLAFKSLAESVKPLFSIGAANKLDSNLLENIINDLDLNVYGIDEIYNKFGTRYKVYDLNIIIYYEMAKEDVIPIDIKEIENNFGEFINYLTERNKKWPNCVFDAVLLFIKF
jgi:hypothetical protein